MPRIEVPRLPRYAAGMFKCAAVDTTSLGEADAILRRIYTENPDYWPNGLSVGHFDGGLWLVREKSSSTPIGFVGWQERPEQTRRGRIKVGYYSIGVLPAYRGNGYAREAVGKLLGMKSASVDEVRALVKQHNQPSLRLAASLRIPVVKLACVGADGKLRA